MYTLATYLSIDFNINKSIVIQHLSELIVHKYVPLWSSIIIIIIIQFSINYHLSNAAYPYIINISAELLFNIVEHICLTPFSSSLNLNVVIFFILFFIWLNTLRKDCNKGSVLVIYTGCKKGASVTDRSAFHNKQLQQKKIKNISRTNVRSHFICEEHVNLTTKTLNVEY